MMPPSRPLPSLAEWRQLLADPIKHWQPDHSAMATAQSWHAAKGLPPEIAALLGAEAKLIEAIPEHKVRLDGFGRDSQCDVFAWVQTAGGLCAVSVEGKVRESFGPTLGGWLEGASKGKLARLAGLCETLGLAQPLAPGLRYQLFHRTAAAVIEATAKPAACAAMIVQSFSDKDLWFEDFAAFCALFGITAQKNTPHRVTLPGGLPLILGWASGDLRFLKDLSA